MKGVELSVRVVDNKETAHTYIHTGERGEE